MKICQFWGKEFMSVKQKYEEIVRKFSFLAQHHFKVESRHFKADVILKQKHHYLW